jgi:gamma-glutamyltranspeptidase/glutathione hydrolase
MVDADGFYPQGVVGRKRPASALSAMVASQHPVVTDSALAVLRDGGNAIDALITACLVQATVSPELTNHAGTVTVLLYHEGSRSVMQLNSPGWLIPKLAPFRPVPVEPSSYSAVPPGANAVVPGFMPAMKACYDRFGSLAWRRLVQPAVTLAAEGHRITSFQHYVMATTLAYFQHSESGRQHFTPAGRLPQVGELWRQPELADTQAGLATNGPDPFINGEWARRFVQRGNEMGWPVRLEHLAARMPEWSQATGFMHRGHRIVSLGAPQIQPVSASLVLGMLDALDIPSHGCYLDSPISAYFLAHVLRRARLEVGYLNDPRVFGDPSSELMDPDYHAHLARIIRNSMPRTDLTGHLAATGRATPSTAVRPGVDSCEISIVDPQGNWVQAMTTLSGSGIPGEVVGGVPMAGSLTDTSLNPVQNISGWYAGGGHVRTVMGNTMVMRDGRPWLALGTPGKVEATVPQVLSRILDFGVAPDEAESQSLMMPLADDYTLAMETDVPASLLTGLGSLGIRVKSLGLSNWHMGSFQMCWRAPDGSLRGSAGARRAGMAQGLTLTS